MESADRFAPDPDIRRLASRRPRLRQPPVRNRPASHRGGRQGWAGAGSRRISDEHRLIYKVVDDEIRIAQCRYHY
ncbi:type II toxin-antitoxin system YoeB family toxin [Frankia sp. AgB32]|uniref:type II toxin-antitoxin system YoeB family toxin n=1 Tax=Frankia sp. AgB32 TaxID=631119 RepID=UPI0024B20E30|nr:type II toxin-antitoxin system YoeB family toxin [Frankia sp. AgB32]